MASVIEIIPNDLREYLSSRTQFKYDVKECEAGRIKLKHLGDLTVEPIYVDSENSPLQESDPNAGRKGYYSVPAISLIDSCEGYDPEGILVAGSAMLWHMGQ